MGRVWPPPVLPRISSPGFRHGLLATRGFAAVPVLPAAARWPPAATVGSVAATIVAGLVVSRLTLGVLGTAGKQRLAAQANLAGRIDIDHLDEHLVALVHFAPDIFHAVVGDLRDVQQAVDAGQDLDERAEVGDPLHLPEVGLVQLGSGRQLLDDGDRLLRRLFIG